MLTIDIGELLSAYYKRKRIYKSALARKTGIGYQSILKHQKIKDFTCGYFAKNLRRFRTQFFDGHSCTTAQNLHDRCSYRHNRFQRN